MFACGWCLSCFVVPYETAFYEFVCVRVFLDSLFNWMLAGVFVWERWVIQHLCLYLSCLCVCVGEGFTCHVCVGEGFTCHVCVGEGFTCHLSVSVWVRVLPVMSFMTRLHLVWMNMPKCAARQMLNPWSSEHLALAWQLSGPIRRPIMVECAVLPYHLHNQASVYYSIISFINNRSLYRRLWVHHWPVYGLVIKQHE